ncbi:MAG: hypothetical protein NZM33_17600, partial [Bryobacteraceae bacterium]|nr:hypothetical protein [Bryobacteraceae bacterium]
CGFAFGCLSACVRTLSGQMNDPTDCTQLAIPVNHKIFRLFYGLPPPCEAHPPAALEQKYHKT